MLIQFFSSRPLHGHSAIAKKYTCSFFIELIPGDVFVFFRFCKVRFVDGGELLASGLPVTPSEFEALVKKQCVRTRDFLKKT